jgi:hypothetical protein
MTIRYVIALLACVSSPVLAASPCATADPMRGAPAARFQDNGDGTVTDRQSRLMWLRCSEGQQWTATGCSGTAKALDWGAAQSLAAEINERGTFFFNDWRLPQLRELATLVERECDAPRVDAAVFPGTPGEFYWTASPRAGEASKASVYALSFGPEGVKSMPRGEGNYVRLVRGAR